MFSNAFGLEVNKHKSAIYFAGMAEYDMQRVVDVSVLLWAQCHSDTWGFPHQQLN